MGYDIELVWDGPAPESLIRNRRLADGLLAAVPGLTEFPINPVVIAAKLGVPLAEVWDRWPQVELHLPGGLLGGCLDLWRDWAFLILPSDPPGGCEAALQRVGKLLEMLAVHGLRVAEPAELLAEYEAQQARVLRVAEMIGGRTPNRSHGPPT